MPSIPGYKITKIFGPISGLTVRTRGVGGKIVAGIEGFFGGEVTAYSEECERARRESLSRLVERSRGIGANAILSADFETTDILQGTATVFSAYGTAVVLEHIEGSESIVFEAGYMQDSTPRTTRLACASCKAVYSYYPHEIIDGMVTCQNCQKKFRVNLQES